MVTKDLLKKDSKFTIVPISMVIDNTCLENISRNTHLNVNGSEEILPDMFFSSNERFTLWYIKREKQDYKHP